MDIEVRRREDVPLVVVVLDLVAAESLRVTGRCKSRGQEDGRHRYCQKTFHRKCNRARRVGAPRGESLNNYMERRSDITRNKCRLSVVLGCLLYTSDAADERSSVDLGGRRIIKKKKS